MLNLALLLASLLLCLLLLLQLDNLAIYEGMVSTLLSTFFVTRDDLEEEEVRNISLKGDLSNINEVQTYFLMTTY